MNNFNFFDYLLIMSLRIKTYKLVGRDYLRRLLNQANEDCYCECCTFCKYIKLIRLELFKNGYQTFNKSVEWWKITETSTKIIATPEIDN